MTASTGSKKNVASSEPIDAIPMKKSSPLMILAIIGGLVVVIGVVAFSLTRGKEKAAPAAQPQAAVAADTAGMTAEEQRRHLEITQKAVANWKDQKAEDDAKKKAADEAAKEKETAAAPVAAGGPAAAPAGGGEAPAPAAKKPPPKKQMDDLDGLGAGISSELGK